MPGAKPKHRCQASLSVIVIFDDHNSFQEDMLTREVGVAAFKAQCLQFIDRVSKDLQPLTITKRGKPVAVLSAVARGRSVPFRAMERPASGLMRASSRRPNPADWNAMR